MYAYHNLYQNLWRHKVIILQLPITIMDFSLTEEEMNSQNNHTYHCQKHG